MEEVFKEVLVCNQGKITGRKLFDPLEEIPTEVPQIVVVTGPRRCDKTSVLYLSLNKGTIATMEQEETLVKDGIEIDIIPYYKNYQKVLEY